MDVLADNPPSIVYPRQELERLSMLLKQGNTEQISQALASIADKIKTSSTTLFVARCLCYDIINTVMRTVYDMNAEIPEVKRTFPDVLTLMEFNTVEELAELISSACVDLCHAIRQHMAQPEGRLIEAMIDYVKTHYNDYDFSIGKLAAEFSLSVSYISRYFKEQTDRNITDFVNHLRIDQAKQLLLDDSRSVKEIVTLIGYSDVSSFIRKFKLLVGMTPGEYRKVFGHRLP
jgi:YesN/AraC family two-component response regulator